MLQDRYGNDLSTASASARDAYVEGMDRFLAAAPDVEAAFQQALAADPDFAPLLCLKSRDVGLQLLPVLKRSPHSRARELRRPPHGPTRSNSNT